MIVVKNSALKHGISERQIREVLADETTKAFELHEDEDGNSQEMLVGFTQSELLLELAVCYKDESEEIFHARRVSAHYRKLFEEENIGKVD